MNAAETFFIIVIALTVILSGVSLFYSSTKNTPIQYNMVCMNGQEFYKTEFGITNHLDDDGKPVKCKK